MQKKFLVNLFLIVLLNLLIKPFYILGVDAEIQNRVGSEIYGNYYALLSFSFLLNIVLDFGINNFNNKNISQNPQLISKHFGKLLSIRFVLFLAYTILTLGSGLLIGYSKNEMYFLLLLVINQFFVATIQYCRSNFAGLHLFKTDAIISVLDRTLLIILCGFLLWSPFVKNDFKIEWFIYAQTFTYASTAIISILILKTKIGASRLNIQKHFTISLLKKSLPYAVLILLMMLYNRIDSVMLERLLSDGNHQAGIYAQGFRFLDAVNMFALLFAGLMLPIFAKLIKQKQSILEILNLNINTLVTMGIIVGVSGFFFRSDIMQWRYSDLESSQSFGYLILSFIPICLTYIYGTLLTANGSLKQLNIMAFFGLSLNLILNFILIPILKAEGAAIATLITQIATALSQVILVFLIFKLKPNYNQIIKLVAVLFFVSGLSYVLKNYANNTNFQLWLFLITVFTSLIFAFIIKTIDLREMVRIIKNKDNILKN